ncbi:MAG: hypothetical protein PHZ19_00280 [Candidatus Thermoplasmatota archaeon]|nr:hypothetical protein [Candidatus Thermoplasmatota archaeon]
MTTRIEIQTRCLKAIVKHLGAFAVNAVLHFREDGLTARVVDLAHVVMVSVEVSRDAFSLYEICEEECGVNLDELKDLLRVDAEKMTLEWDVGAVTLRIFYQDTGSPVVLKLTAPSPSDIVEPKAIDISEGLKVRFEVDGEKLERFMSFASTISDTVKLSWSQALGMPTITAEGDRKLMHIGFPHSTLKEGVATSCFPGDYFKTIAETCKYSYLEVAIGTDYPVTIRGAERCPQPVHFTYILAPRIVMS